MKIVILDGYTVNPGDLDWNPVKELGELEIYDRTPPEKVIERSLGAKIVITNKVILDDDIMAQLPDLKYIGVIATGYNVVDLEGARKRDIVITNIPNYSTQSVAELVFAHIMELARRVGHHNRSVREGNWSGCRDFTYWDYTQIELKDKILGLVGCGNIGQAVAKIGLTFGMKILIYDICRRDMDLDVQMADLETLYSRSDFISLHCPLTDDTRGMINRDTLKKMKPTAFLINTARGPLVHESDLAEALNSGVIAGAGLDVLSVEPPPPDNPLLTAKNCHITPHIAWASPESRRRLIEKTAENIRAFLDGNPVNVVN